MAKATNLVPARDPAQLAAELGKTFDAFPAMLQVVGVSSRKGDVRLLFRAKNVADWLAVLSLILAEEARAPAWYSFIGEKYFLNGGKLVKAWGILLDSGEGGSLDAAVSGFRKLLIASIERVNGATTAAVVAPKEIVVALPWAAGYEEGMQGRVAGLGGIEPATRQGVKPRGMR